jgi:hypothetical protein
LAGTTVPKATLTNGAAFDSSVTKLSALIGPVEEPTINYKSLFTATTLSLNQSYTLRWMKPSLGNATGYLVTLSTPATVGARTFFAQVARLSTSKTEMTLPPSLLQGGKTYYFTITAITDGRANIESSPNRFGFPAGNADIISAPISIVP